MKKFLTILLATLVSVMLALSFSACVDKNSGVKGCKHVAKTETGHCADCGYPISPTEGVLYQLAEDKTYASVTGYEGIATWVRIADNYEGVPVTEIGDSAFHTCHRLTSVVIPDSVTSIGENAFRSCSSLTSIVIPDSVTSIGEEAFSHCSSLTSVVIGDSVTSIGDWAFAGCSSLTSIEIPDSVTSIGEDAFKDCSSLTSIVIPDSVTSIGDYAFDGCYKLVEVINKSTHITVTKGDTDNGWIGHYALAVYNSGDTFTGTKLSNDNGYIIYTDGEEKILVGYNGAETDLVLPSYITKVYQYAFHTCHRLTSVVIPDSVTSIGYRAFWNCSGLTSVVIPDGVTSIGDYAFLGCSSLTEIVIPDSVTSIGWHAFDGCSSLTIYCEAESQPSGWDSSWNNSNRPVVWGYKE